MECWRTGGHPPFHTPVLQYSNTPSVRSAGRASTELARAVRASDAGSFYYTHLIFRASIDFWDCPRRSSAVSTGQRTAGQNATASSIGVASLPLTRTVWEGTFVFGLGLSILLLSRRIRPPSEGSLT